MTRLTRDGVIIIIVNLFLCQCLDFLFIVFIADGDCKKAERDNRANSPIPVSGAPTASGLGRRQGETSHNDGTQRHYWSKCLLVAAIKEINLPRVNNSFYGANVGRSCFVSMTAESSDLITIFGNSL